MVLMMMLLVPLLPMLFLLPIVVIAGHADDRVAIVLVVVVADALVAVAIDVAASTIAFDAFIFAACHDDFVAATVVASFFADVGDVTGHDYVLASTTLVVVGCVARHDDAGVGIVGTEIPLPSLRRLIDLWNYFRLVAWI
jgi:hypothetical protein